jgi:DNA polymerase I
MPTLYLIDGYAQFFRAYHAIKAAMTSPVTKEPTNMTFGFVGMMLKLLRGEGNLGGAPEFVCVTLDVSGDRETFRSELYPQYKANRQKPPEDLFPQVDRCVRLLNTIGVPTLGVEGFEADDVIATLVDRLRATHPNLRVRIVSKDKDLKQLLRPAAPIVGIPGEAPAFAPVELFDVHTDTPYTAATLMAETGLKPEQVLDMLTLMGDAVDNVPGVEGVGDKTAAQLMREYGSLDALLSRSGEVPGKRGEKLRAAAPNLGLSKQLITLRRDVPVEFDLEKCRASRFVLGELMPVLRELGFNRYQDELKRIMAEQDRARAGGAASAPTAAEGARAAAAARAGARDAKADPPTLFGGGAVKPSVEKGGAAAKPEDASARSDAGQAGLFGGGSLGGSGGGSGGGAGGGLFDAVGDGGGVGPVARVSSEHTEKSDYRCITTREQLAALVQELNAAALIAIDTETTALSPINAKLCGICLSTREAAGVYIPVRSPAAATHLNEAEVIAALRPVLEDAAKPKCGHNLKYDLIVLRNCGVTLRGMYPARNLTESVAAAANAAIQSEAEAGAQDAGPFPGGDSMVASYLIDASRSSHSLDALALSLLKRENIHIADLLGPRAAGDDRAGSKSQRTFDTVPLEIATTYAAEDADVSLQLITRMRPELRAMGLAGLMDRVEMPLVEVLAELEYNGIRCEPKELDRQRERLQTRIDSLRKEIDAKALASLGRRFDPDSPKQLAAALFHSETDEPAGLGIKPVKKTKTGYSTDAEVLEKLAEDTTLETPIPRLILEYRQLTKLVGTYLVALKDAINPRTGRIHASFHQTVAATGRLASSDPNLQNIPIRTEIGREIRRAFVAEPGHVLITADYSQIELRLLAHLSRDPALIEAFRRGEDIHTQVAAQIHNVPLNEVTKDQRAGAKMVNFGIVYGITSYGLARRLGVSNEAAAVIIDGYKRRFAGITTFLAECVDQARRYGYVDTMLKRRRPIVDIDSSNPSRRALAERTAINSVVQGSAADLIKLAMVDIHARIVAARDRAAGMKVEASEADAPAFLARVNMLLQIHDELVFEAPEEIADAVRRFIVQRMEAAMSLDVPLKADSGVARNWFEGK